MLKSSTFLLTFWLRWPPHRPAPARHWIHVSTARHSLAQLYLLAKQRATRAASLSALWRRISETLLFSMCQNFQKNLLQCFSFYKTMGSSASIVHWFSCYNCAHTHSHSLGTVSVKLWIFLVSGQWSCPFLRNKCAEWEYCAFLKDNHTGKVEPTIFKWLQDVDNNS